MTPRDDIERGYAWFLGAQLRDEQVVILVAECGEGVVGYTYAGVGPQSWKELRDECGFVHDLVVEERMRGQGIATALLEAAIEWFRARGIPRVVLCTADRNEAAQRLFASRGFRRTMIEMTREIVE
jgi:GNAT superfamily N-acetyltransferase